MRAQLAARCANSWCTNSAIIYMTKSQTVSKPPEGQAGVLSQREINLGLAAVEAWREDYGVDDVPAMEELVKSVLEAALHPRQ